MLKRFFPLIVLLSNTLQAQNTIVAGKFPYQRNVPFSVEFISNQIILIDEWGKIADTSDANGHFKVSLQLDKPSIIRFSQNDFIELYLRPGDSLWVEMINARNVSFAGTAAGENTLLMQVHNRPFIPLETAEDPLLFSQMIDTFYSAQMQGLAHYEADQPNADFVPLYLAKVYDRYLNDKIKIYNTLVREGLEGNLMDRLSRQIRSVPLVDEIRAEAYINTLHTLFTMETLKIMGQELEPQEIGQHTYPIGYTEVFQGHVKERLSAYPQLKQYFELQEIVYQIQMIKNVEQLADAASGLARLKKEEGYVSLYKLMQQTYRKKEIIYQLGKLPTANWLTPEGQVFQLNTSADQQTLVVFWDVNVPESVAALKYFQRESPIKPLGTMRYIWVQCGGDKELWKRKIAEIPNTYSVQHCILEKPADLAALKPYFFRPELPISFTLSQDLTIKSMGNKPSALLDEMWEVMSVGGRLIWKARRE
ncbi:hypothetical protein [Haliscomenobacter hydrossis]|uniref:Uncharacterized protein n=1 Tax=Haliscomenobacter hydrossis (strain ATCC 27775 / DSM 1100 / LMG 10767 / O) TaxID=760192 RepID=F4KTQ7_HALH1|nr:hypothetical protein [Haliscomenobacter hydrossis]AEE48051.1 hypothetical protein Halhy_0138 [Haliscomenobacter hydrossis DSM 1100]